jgi:thiamine-phosphate pyrophosphorylase
MTDPVPSRLYLISPSEIELPKFVDDVAAALQSGDVACLLLQLSEAGDDELREAINAVMPVCHEHDVALVIYGRAHIAAELNTDGVHVEADQCTQARALVGADRIVGVTSARSRHAAMDAAEAGADFVAFAPEGSALDGDAPDDAEAEIFEQDDIIRWWQDLIEVPCAALGPDMTGLSLADCSHFAALGADFVGVGDIVWQHADGPAAGVAAAISAISVA